MSGGFEGRPASVTTRRLVSHAKPKVPLKNTRRVVLSTAVNLGEFTVNYTESALLYPFLGLCDHSTEFSKFGSNVPFENI